MVIGDVREFKVASLHEDPDAGSMHSVRKEGRPPNRKARIQVQAGRLEADRAGAMGRDSEWIPILQGEANEVPPPSVGIKQEKKGAAS